MIPADFPTSDIGKMKIIDTSFLGHQTLNRIESMEII